MIAACLRAVLISGGVLAAVAACGSDAPDETETLISITDGVIVPHYEAAAGEMAELSAALAGLCAAPSDAALDAARKAWRSARVAWSRSEASGVGPVQDRRSTGLIAWPVVEGERIDALLADNASVTADVVRNEISSTQRGLGAVEYLLFEEEARLSLAADPARCSYLAVVGEIAAGEAAAVFNEWQVARGGDGPPYKDFFTGRASSSLLPNQAVADLVRTQVFLIRDIVDMKLAGALGLRGDADPSAIPGGAARNALAELRSQVLGMRDVYEGAEGGHGVSSLIVPLSADTDERMRAHFEASLAVMDTVEGSLRGEAAARSPQALAVYEELMALQNTLSTEVVSLLGVAVGFSDADGDSLR